MFYFNINLLSYRVPPYGGFEWNTWGYYPKNCAIIFILIIALYTCVPFHPKSCFMLGIIVSIAHFIALVVEYVTTVLVQDNEKTSDDTSDYSHYMLRLVRYNENNKKSILISYYNRYKTWCNIHLHNLW